MVFDLSKLVEEDAPAAPTPLAHWFIKTEAQKELERVEAIAREEASLRAAAAAERAAAATQRAAAAAERAAILTQSVTSTLDGAQQNLEDLRDNLFDQLRVKQARPAF